MYLLYIYDMYYIYNLGDVCVKNCEVLLFQKKKK